MQKRQYIYYRHKDGETYPGKILQFSRDREWVQLSYLPLEEEEQRIVWVKTANIEPQTRESEVALSDGAKVWVTQDCIEYKGKDVYRFEAPCACKPSVAAMTAARGRVIVGGGLWLFYSREKRIMTTNYGKPPQKAGRFD
ncbi:MAG: hypothetical protein KDD43_08275, partial [Bdellovibrionales bacterium]|nr:hypothetical protein [Bdellovibrionales bacterium]